jgi:CRP/FNR family transcriptional regulator, anaerobic regulatory protein
MAIPSELPDEELLYQILHFIAPISASLREELGTCLKRENHPKKKVLVRPGEISRKIYFIRDGFARACYHDAEGREHTTWFMGPGDFMISVYSFFSQQPAAEQVELLADSRLLSITWDQLQSLYAGHPEFNFHGRIITQKYYIQSEERAVLLRTKKPAERYRMLLAKYPKLLQQASLGQIASFLSITQETLSRLRAGPSL